MKLTTARLSPAVTDTPVGTPGTEGEPPQADSSSVIRTANQARGFFMGRTLSTGAGKGNRTHPYNRTLRARAPGRRGPAAHPQENRMQESSDRAARPASPRPVGVIGLGAMGMGVARTLLRKGFEVHACDLHEHARAEISAAGGHAHETPAAVA